MDNRYKDSNQGLRAVVAAYNRFGFRLFRKIADKRTDKNILLSPASVAASLALMHQGAGGSTRRAIADVLGVGGTDGEALNRGNAMFLSALEDSGPQVRIMTAMAFWVSNGLAFDPAFRSLAREFYDAETASVDFADPATAEVINRWGREKTGGKLEHLLSENDLGAATESVLTNAVYFKGLWATPFDKRATRDGVFHLPGGESKRVPLMSQSVRCPYLRGDAFQAIGLHYGDGRFGMYIFLPDDDSSLMVFLDKLDEVNWERWLSEYDDSVVDVTLPRFGLTLEYELKEPLSDLGMAVAFSTSADFSPMGLGPLFISKVKHKAVVEVEEEGTEAAAATAVVMGRSILMPIPFTVDRAFFWAIRDNLHGTIIFTGVVAEPD